MKFTEKEKRFINEVLGIPVGDEEDRKEVLDSIWEEAFECEIKEANANDCTSEIGKIAADLVTKLDEDDDEDEEER